jgi:hypothetical protein
LAGSLVFAVACNDSSSSTTENSDSAKMDTSSAMADNSNVPVVSIVKNTLELNGANEVPANTSKATGTADVSYNKDSKVLTYTVNYKDLTGKASMAHIHGTAPKGANAGVKKDLTPVLQKDMSGSFTDSVKIDASGISEDSLMQGFYYFNIHTPKNPGGEIRAQIQF